MSGCDILFCQRHRSTGKYGKAHCSLTPRPHRPSRGVEEDNGTHTDQYIDVQGLQPGRQLSDSLKLALGDSTVATQGVDYSAALLGNLAAGGTYPNDTAVYVDLINEAATECPTSKVVLTGYSQGAALVVNALQNVTDTVKDQVAAAVCFGDTQDFQDGGVIPNFDTNKTALYCNTGDVICEAGILLVTAAHENYTNHVSEASVFILSRL